MAALEAEKWIAEHVHDSALETGEIAVAR